MKLKVDEVRNNIELLVSDPFQPFEEDCDTCISFYSFPLIYPSGECTKHGFGCGYGFTCKDYKLRTNK